MKDKVVRSKLNYFAWILSFLAICLLVGVFVYIQTSPISLTGHLVVTLQGANEEAYIVSIENPESDDGRYKEFFSNITYEAYPSINLSNGQTITIQATADLELNRQFHIFTNSQIVNLTITGLSEEGGITIIELNEP